MTNMPRPTPSSASNPTATSADSPISAGPSEDLAQRFAVMRALASTDVEAATVDASLRTGLLSVPGAAAEGPRYTFEAVFASGGLGKIRRAYDHRLGRHVAVKELQNYVPGGRPSLPAPGRRRPGGSLGPRHPQLRPRQRAARQRRAQAADHARRPPRPARA
jgi:hypothetical protein